MDMEELSKNNNNNKKNKNNKMISTKIRANINFTMD